MCWIAFENVTLIPFRVLLKTSFDAIRFIRSLFFGVACKADMYRLSLYAEKTAVLTITDKVITVTLLVGISGHTKVGNSIFTD